MRRVLRIDASDILPSRRRVLLRAGVPVDRMPSSRTLALVREAVDLFVAEARPVGVFEELTLEELHAVHRDGRPPGEDSVLERVVPHARRLALFAATVGEPVCARIRRLFAEGDAPLGLLLDAVASEATTALAEEMGDALLGDRAEPGLAVLAYSPGYCGWPVTGQRALFARLAPGEIGISLGESALMAPVKSVSGVLVVAPLRAHRFKPDFDFCEACTERTCLERMASLRSPAGLPETEGDVPWTS
ncbi:MAG TPA: hypothetical protein VE129_12355 [Thermoanaerobaculia bacterium]|nr:hypothetical protein [Thermoanaerobaculia bacterium]